MAYQGGSYRGAVRKGGSGAMKGGGSAIPRYQPSPFILWRVGHSDIGDVVERGHGRVAGQDAHIVPPLGLHSLPLKRKVRMVSLRLTGRKMVTDGNHVYPHGAVNEASGGVDCTKARLGLAHGVSMQCCVRCRAGYVFPDCRFMSYGARPICNPVIL